MKKIEKEEYKQLVLEMLDVFSKVCEEHNLRYVLEFGTLLGAVRHKGFIPWDDDIDVSMPREDYEKLIRLFEKDDNLFGDHFKLAHFDNKYSVRKVILNLIDTRTITHSNMRRKMFFYPVWIDIFPFDYCEETAECEKRTQQVRKLQLRTQRAVCYFRRNIRGTLKNIENWMIFPFQKMLFRRTERIKKELKTGTAFLNYNEGTTKLSCPLNYFDDYTYMEFEGKEYRVTRDYDLRLKTLFGDYMQLPPVDERPTHFTEAYWV